MRRLKGKTCSPPAALEPWETTEKGEYRLSRLQGEPLRVFDDFGREIHIEVRPIEVARIRFLHIKNLTNRCIFEPGKILKGHEQLPVSGENPNSMTGDVGYLNRGGSSKRF